MGGSDGCVEDFRGGLKFEAFSGSIVEFAFDVCKLGQADILQIHPFGKVLSNDAVRIFIRPAFPRAIRMRKIDFHSQLCFNRFVFSDFTRAFGEAIFLHDADPIRYADVLSGITDYFSQRGRQTPTFVTQADHTELFFQMSSDLRDALKTLLFPSSQSTESKASVQPAGNGRSAEAMTASQLLAARVKKQAEFYCTEEKALATFAAMKEALDGWRITPELAELFKVTLEYSASSHSNAPSKSVIGKWASESPEVFATVEYKNEEYEAETQVQSAFSIFSYEMKTVTRTRRVIGDFANTSDTEFYFVQIGFIPSLVNLRHWRAFLILLCSKSTLHIFSTLVELRDLNWKEQRAPTSAKWSKTNLLLSNSELACSELRAVLEGFETTIVTNLESTVDSPRIFDKGEGQRSSIK